MSAAEESPEEATTVFRGPITWAIEAEKSRIVHTLLLLDDNGAPRRINLDSLPIVIGRAPPADLVLEGGSVSRRHCRFDLTGDKVTLTDMNSTNGTYLDGVRLDAAVTLVDGMTIAVGGHRLRYQRRDHAEAAEAEAMDRDMQAASNYVASILPPPIEAGAVETEWFYQPCARLGGDAFGYQMVSDRHFMLFLLDVAGHGAGAALHAVSVANVLRQKMLPGVDFADPSAVIGSLNKMFTMEQHNELFFTIWYGVYDTVSRELAFAAGGHHAGYLITPGSAEPMPLSTRNPAVGIVPDRAVTASRIAVPVGSALSLFTDGVFEIVDQTGKQWGMAELLPLLPASAGKGGPRKLYDQIRAASRPGAMDDDFSVLVVRFP